MNKSKLLNMQFLIKIVKRINKIVEKEITPVISIVVGIPTSLPKTWYFTAQILYLGENKTNLPLFLRVQSQTTNGSFCKFRIQSISTFFQRV